MYNNSNPAELYSGTTWELLVSDKYIRTGTTALSTGGSNSVSIAKTNLPNISLKVNTFSLTTNKHRHYTVYNAQANTLLESYASFPLTRQGQWGTGDHDYKLGTMNYDTTPNSSHTNDVAPTTGTASPSTESLGSGTAISIQPTYITLKFWKRLT